MGRRRHEERGRKRENVNRKDGKNVKERYQKCVKEKGRIRGENKKNVKEKRLWAKGR